MPKQKRDNDYYMQRLKKERPNLYRDVLAGKLTVNKARQQHGGLGGVRTPLSKLKSAWDAATAKERSDFLLWARISGAGAVTAPVAIPAATAVFDASNRMEAWAGRRVLEVIDRRSLSAGDFAQELGLDRLNQSVITAARRGTKVRSPSVRSSVEAWLSKNASV
jgi:hypothetical protein